MLICNNIEMRTFKTELMLFLCFLPVASRAPCQSYSPDEPVIIRDTDIADGIERVEPPKEYDPQEAEKNIEVGKFYAKRKNYVGAIGRYITALEYQSDSKEALEEFRRTFGSLVEHIDSLPADTTEELHSIHHMIRQTIDYMEHYLLNCTDPERRSDFREKITVLEAKIPQ